MVNIEEIIDHYHIQKIKKGKTTKYLCPFHDDHEESLSIDKKLNIFNCFTCHTGGNAIRFIMLYEGLDYISAYNKFVDIANLPIELKKDIKKEKSYARYTDQEIRIIDLHNHINEYLSYCLSINQDGSKSYLENRKIDNDVNDHFNLGYMGKLDGLLTYLEKKFHYTLDDLKQSSFFNIVNNRIHCNFENRIIIPIKDYNGSICGFAGRKFNESATIDAKYINSSDSAIYHKSKLLYNLNNAKRYINKEKRVYITEGYFDVSAEYKSGINNCVALCGTALTNDHIALLKQLDDSIEMCIVTDGDRAGRKSAVRSLRLLESNGLNAYGIFLPKQCDPDEIYQNEGMDALRKAMLNKFSPMEFEIEYLTESMENTFVSKPDQRKIINDFLCRIAKNKYEPLEKNMYIHLLSERFDISTEILKDQLQFLNKSKIQHRTEEHNRSYATMMQNKRMIGASK